MMIRLLFRDLLLLGFASSVAVGALAAESTERQATDAKTQTAHASLASYLGESFVSRSAWNALASDYDALLETGDISLDEAKVLASLHHTVTGAREAVAGRIPANLEAELVLRMQESHVKARGWSDIGYHFLVGQSGKVFEGRPSQFVGAHTGGLNKKNLGIAFIGCFDEEGCSADGVPVTEVTDEMIDAAAKLIAFVSLQEGFDVDEAHVVARSVHDVAVTGKTRFPASPGNLVIARLSELRQKASDYRAALAETQQAALANK